MILFICVILLHIGYLLLTRVIHQVTLEKCFDLEFANAFYL